MSKYIKYIQLKSNFGENRRNNYKLAEISQFEKLIEETGETSIFEILMTNDPVKIYLDIENIPKDDTQLIYEIINKFKEFVKRTANYDLEKYVLTQNQHSRHDGLSYHLIFTEYYVRHNYEIKAMITQFISENPDYKNFIDMSVYSNKRLFRCINQKNVKNKNTDGEIDDDDMHKIISENGTVAESVIQNTYNLKLLEHEYPMNKDFADSANPSFKYVKRQERKQPIKIKIVNNIPTTKPTTAPDIQISNTDEIMGKLLALTLTSQNPNVVNWAKNEIKYYEKNKTFSIPIGQLHVMLNNLH